MYSLNNLDEKDDYEYKYAVTNQTINGDVTMQYNEMELMQYTGLKDKNGKEIYEGDIVKMLREDNCFGEEDYEETFVIEQPEYYELSDKSSGGADGDRPIKSMEVIGNIYENPELIK